MLINKATSMIQPASSQGRKLLKHWRWAPWLSLEIHHQLRLTEASNSRSSNDDLVGAEQGVEHAGLRCEHAYFHRTSIVAQTAFQFGRRASSLEIGGLFTPRRPVRPLNLSPACDS